MLMRDSTTKQVISTVNFGIVEVGLNKTISIIIENDTKAKLINLVFSLNNKNVKITKFPTTLAPYESSELILLWTPEIDVKEPLKAQINVSGNEIYE